MLTIELPAELEKKLTERAVRSGQSPEAMARAFIERGVNEERSLDEILKPFRDEVLKSGMSDDELESLFESVRDEAHSRRADR